jgi:hypothetical protein
VLVFRPLKFMSISLEQRLSITANDNLDGYRWAQDEYTGYTVSNDMLSYTSLNFGFHVGAKTRTEPFILVESNGLHVQKIERCES